VERFISKSPFWGSKLIYTEHLITQIRKNFQGRKKAYDIIHLLQEGSQEPGLMAELKLIAKNDLIVQMDLLPYAQQLTRAEYVEMRGRLEKMVDADAIVELTELSNELLSNLDFPNRGPLLTEVQEHIRRQTLISYTVAFRLWTRIAPAISGVVAEFHTKLMETVRQRGSYNLQQQDLTLQINVTGVEPEDIVNFNFFGGPTARALRTELEDQFGLELHPDDQPSDEDESG
jgi:hypothetical protein